MAATHVFKGNWDHSYSGKQYVSEGERFSEWEEAFCPECVREDLELLGFSFWRRYGAPYVTVCHNHNVVLQSLCPHCSRPFVKVYERCDCFAQDLNSVKDAGRPIESLWSSYLAGGIESANFVEERYEHGVGMWSCPQPSPLSEEDQSHDGFYRRRPKIYSCCNLEQPKTKGYQLKPVTVPALPGITRVDTQWSHGAGGLGGRHFRDRGHWSRGSIETQIRGQWDRHARRPPNHPPTNGPLAGYGYDVVETEVPEALLMMTACELAWLPQS